MQNVYQTSQVYGIKQAKIWLFFKTAAIYLVVTS